MANVPAITGPQLIRLLQLDGWENVRIANHGALMRRRFDDQTRITVVPCKDKNKSLPKSLLNGILSAKQTGLGREGLMALIEEFGIE